MEWNGMECGCGGTAITFYGYSSSYLYVSTRVLQSVICEVPNKVNAFLESPTKPDLRKTCSFWSPPSHGLTPLKTGNPSLWVQEIEFWPFDWVHALASVGIQRKKQANGRDGARRGLEIVGDVGSGWNKASAQPESRIQSPMADWEQRQIDYCTCGNSNS